MANKGGRPRRDGSPARPRKVDPRTGRFTKDLTPDRFTPAPVAPKSQPGAVPGGTLASPSMESQLPTDTGPEAARRAVEDSLGGGASQQPGAAATAAAAPSLALDYAMTIRVVNMLLTAQVPGFAMTPDEEKAIGDALDVVIAKHWPGLKNAGPEAALLVALLGWLARCWFARKKATPTTAAWDPPPPPSTDTVSSETNGKPTSGTSHNHSQREGADR